MYGYVLDNPLNATDPTGMATCDTSTGAGTSNTNAGGIAASDNVCSSPYEGSESAIYQEGDPGVYTPAGPIIPKFGGSGESQIPCTPICSVKLGGVYDPSSVYKAQINAQLAQGSSRAPNNGTKKQGCSVLDPNCKQPSKILQYATFLGCEFNSDIEQLTDEEDAQHPSQIPIVFSAIATVGGLTGKVPGWAGITGAVTGGIYTIGIAVKSNQECTESVYGH